MRPGPRATHSTGVAQAEFAVGELSHRVSNELQVVGVLLARAARLEGDDLRRALADASCRVQAMAAVHRRLCGSFFLDQSLGVALAGLCRDVAAIHGREDVFVSVEACDLSLISAQRNGVFLLVAELTSNALKHAFRHKGGSVTVLVREVSGEVTLIVQDDGCGFAPECARPRDRFGWRIIAGLAAGLGGITEVESQPDIGTTVRVDFLVSSQAGLA